MKKKNLIALILVVFVLILLAFFLIKQIKSFSSPTKGLPDWVIKPKANYSGLYCAVISSANGTEILQQLKCSYPEIYVLNNDYHRIKSLFGPQTENSDLRLAVFNISYEEAKSENLGLQKLLELEIENPYEEIYFCDFNNEPQEYWDCIEGLNSTLESASKCTNFYNLQFNNYIENNQLGYFCEKV